MDSSGLAHTTWVNSFRKKMERSDTDGLAATDEQRLKVATSHDVLTPYNQIIADSDLRNNAPTDIAKLIAAVQQAKETIEW